MVILAERKFFIDCFLTGYRSLILISYLTITYHFKVGRVVWASSTLIFMYFVYLVYGRHDVIMHP